MSRRIWIPRRATAANAAASNPILYDGERGYETDTGKWKTGDGVTHWVDLPYEESVTGDSSWASITGKPSTFPPSTHSHAWSDITGKPTTFAPAAHTHPIADITDLQGFLTGLGAEIDAKPDDADITDAVAAGLVTIRDGVAAGYNTLAKLKTAIDAIETGEPEVHYLIWTGSAWPARAADGLPVIWVGGEAPDDQPPEHEAGDVWIPTTGDNIDLGAVLNALQALTPAASTIPYFTSSTVAALLGLKTALTENSDTNIATQKAVKTAVDAVIASILVVPANRQTASYTAVLADAGKAVEMNVASANNFTVPPNTTEAFPVNTVIEVFQYGAGQTTIVAGSGVTIRSSGGKLKLTGQYSGASLRKVATDEWVLQGDITS